MNEWSLIILRFTRVYRLINYYQNLFSNRDVEILKTRKCPLHGQPAGGGGDFFHHYNIPDNFKFFVTDEHGTSNG